MSGLTFQSQERNSLEPHKDTPHHGGQQPAECDFEQLLPEAAIILAVNSTKITEITSSKVPYLWLIVQYKFPQKCSPTAALQIHTTLQGNFLKQVSNVFRK